MRRGGLLLLVAALAGCMRMGFRPPEDGPERREGVVGEVTRRDLPDGALDLPTDQPGPKGDRPDGGIDAPGPDRGPPDGPRPPDGVNPDLKKPDLKKPDLKKPDAPSLDAPKPDLKKVDLPKPISDLPKPISDLPKPDQPSTVAPWWNPIYAHRIEIALANAGGTGRANEPVFVSGGKLLAVVPGGALPIKESSLRLLRWTAASGHVEVPFALHDWTASGDALGDSDGDLDANDELLLLGDVPTALATYFLYYDTVDKTPVVHPKVSVTPGGSGISAVFLDGAQQAAGYLRAKQGAQTTYDLMLVDSIPFWNHTGFFTHESSAIGPRINNVTLPGGTKVMSTVNHTTGSPAGDLVHTIRLGPLRLDGNFNILSSENAFFQPRLVLGNAHSAVHAHGRPLAAVVVIDAELYCDEDKDCSPPKDLGDVRLVGYLFAARGGADEVLMRWRVSASMSGAGTIKSGTQSSCSDEYSLASYLVEGYAEAQFPALIDIDTVRVREQGTGTVSSGKFDTTASEQRVCKDTDSWILMSDTDAPYGGVIALLPEATPVKNGTPLSSWRGCWFQDGPGTLEPNGFQSEWHLAHPSFQSWGSAANDSMSYSYWIFSYPHPATGDDHAPATSAAGWVRLPLGVSASYRAKF